MSEILHDLSAPAIIAAIEANLAEEMANFGRHLPYAELHEDPELQWFITGIPSPGFNCVLRTHFTPGDIDTKIRETIRRFKARNVPMSWSISPSTQPANLDEYLKAYGFTHVRHGTGMAADLLDLNEEISIPADFTIEEIRDSETLSQGLSVAVQGFGSDESHMKIYYDTYINAGFGNHLPWHHYIGRLDGEPVAISSLLLHAGVAGVYGVATLPKARRQGIGAAMTLAPIHEARAQGYRIGILSPTELGLGIYRRLGFQEYCKMSYYRLAL